MVAFFLGNFFYRLDRLRLLLLDFSLLLSLIRFRLMFLRWFLHSVCFDVFLIWGLAHFLDWWFENKLAFILFAWAFVWFFLNRLFKLVLLAHLIRFILCNISLRISVRIFYILIRFTLEIRFCFVFDFL